MNRADLWIRNKFTWDTCQVKDVFSPRQIVFIENADTLETLGLGDWEFVQAPTDPRKPVQLDADYHTYELNCRVNDLEAELEVARRMETDLAKVRRAIGDIAFNKIINDE